MSGRTPLVLLHGFTAGPGVWGPVRPMLEEHHDVHTLTLDGHHGGRPLDLGVEPSMTAFADGLVRELDARGLETAYLVGNSLGGWLALELAVRGRARGVVCLAPAGGWEPGSTFEKTLAVQFAGALLMSKVLAPRSMRRAGLRKLLLGPTVAHPERVPIPAAMEIAEDLAGCAVLLPSLLRSRRRALHDLGPISVPVRIAWSAEDHVLDPRVARGRFVRLVPQAEQLELPGVGHVPMSDAPDLVARTILDVTAA